LQLLEGRYVYSATDLNNYLECEHLVALERRVAQRLLVRPGDFDPTAQLVKRKGDEHEQRRWNAYVTELGDTAVSFAQRPNNSRSGLVAAEAQTIAAMARGARIIYQATFFDGQFVGHADFLRRIEVPSRRWSWSYEVIDTKLALSPKPYFLIQLCNYSEHLERVQGSAPQHGYIVLGSGEERAFRIAGYAAYYRHLKRSFLTSVESLDGAYPLEISHCGICVWSGACKERREADDHLSLVAGIRADQRAKLEDAGIVTMTQLAAARERPWRMTEGAFDNLRVQALLQVEQRRAIARGEDQPYRYRFREELRTQESAPQPPAAGFAKLPEPAPGDIFFDIEGDPLYRPDRGLEYLFGFYLPDEDRYVPFWAKDSGEERLAFEASVDFIAQRLARYPDLHVYHYASYEKSALRRLMGRFASREREIDNFLIRGLFVDLYPIVRQAMWISQPSYSLKKVEAFYALKRSTVTRGGDDSIAMFEAWLASEDPALLEDIERYNEDDCRSTYRLRDWLVALRNEYNTKRGEPLPWRAPIEPPPERPEPPRTELEKQLLGDLVAPDSLAALRAEPEQFRARWLLGNIIQYHRRENKPAHWEYYERCENVEDLVEFDRNAIGGLRRRIDVTPEKIGNDRNLVYTYEYPLQEHYLRSGKPHCPDSKAAVTQVIAHDEAAREIRLKLNAEMAKRLRALIPGKPLPHFDKQAAVERIASAYLAGQLAADYPATAALLLESLPRLRDRIVGGRIQPDTVDVTSLSRTVEALDDSYLFVQGPPGTGKSTLGAAAIVDLLRANRRVAIMANNHKALHNLLRKIEERARDGGVRFAGCHKDSGLTEGSTYESPLAVPFVRNVSKTTELLLGHLASGTAFAWTDESLAGKFDYIFIDEAGQVSLADALIASLAARNVVLLGDPQQLPQVSQGSHPVGSDLSILAHLLGDRETVAPERGVFLDVTYRMQPAITSFVSTTSYEGRLRDNPATAANRIDSPGLSGGGLAYVPVAHQGNGRFSDEESDRIVREVGLLLQGTVVLGAGPRRPLQQRDILVVAPYNLQRRRLGERLCSAGYGGVAVGTVDKFQGQEAPVVFYSMATSSDEDLPRDMNFLFDKNRFNVAVSRAQCLSVLVCSPRLLDARCNRPEQMELVNLLCAFAEQATPPAALPVSVPA